MVALRKLSRTKAARSCRIIPLSLRAIRFGNKRIAPDRTGSRLAADIINSAFPSAIRLPMAKVSTRHPNERVQSRYASRCSRSHNFVFRITYDRVVSYFNPLLQFGEAQFAGEQTRRNRLRARDWI